MVRRMTFVSIGVCCLVLCLPNATLVSADEASSELLKMIVALIADQDQDFRAAGLDHVRAGAKGAAATKIFTDQLPELPPASQVSLLNALADRGDASARPAVLQLLASSHEETVRAASLSALGQLGDIADLPLLIDSLSSKSDIEQVAARKSLARVKGDDITKMMATQLNAAKPDVKAALIEVLAARRAKDAMPAFVAASIDDNPKVRGAAMNALGQIGSPDHIAAILPGILKATKGGERDAAEKHVALICARIDKEGPRAEALIKAMATFETNERDQLLSLVGRVGGKKLMEYVGDIAKGSDGSRRKLAIDSLSKWPDASVADMLREITENTTDASERNSAFQAYVKVCAARDKRKDEERLESLKKAFKIAKTPEEQSLVINRSRTAYHVDTLRFILPHVDDAQFAQVACETIVELAHHREVRDPNKAEFDKALDKVIGTSKNATVVERANAYKKGETWSR